MGGGDGGGGAGDRVLVMGLVNHQCTLGKSLNGNSREQSNIKWQFLKKVMMEAEMF